MLDSKKLFSSWAWTQRLGGLQFWVTVSTSDRSAGDLPMEPCSWALLRRNCQVGPEAVGIQNPGGELVTGQAAAGGLQTHHSAFFPSVRPTSSISEARVEAGRDVLAKAGGVTGAYGRKTASGMLCSMPDDPPPLRVWKHKFHGVQRRGRSDRQMGP